MPKNANARHNDETPKTSTARDTEVMTDAQAQPVSTEITAGEALTQGHLASSEISITTAHHQAQQDAIAYVQQYAKTTQQLTPVLQQSIKDAQKTLFNAAQNVDRADIAPLNEEGEAAFLERMRTEFAQVSTPQLSNQSVTTSTAA